MPKSDDVILVEAQQDIRELEQHIADQHILIKKVDASGSEDDQAKAREGLFLLEDALETASAGRTQGARHGALTVYETSRANHHSSKLGFGSI